MQAIDIQEVIAHIQDPETPEFLLGFVRSQGKRQGSIKILERARRGGRKGRERKSAKDATGRGAFLHKDAGTLPIFDIKDQRYMSVKISHIIRFNQYKVYH